MHKCTYRSNTITRIRKKPTTPKREYMLHGTRRVD